MNNITSKQTAIYIYSYLRFSIFTNVLGTVLNVRYYDKQRGYVTRRQAFGGLHIIRTHIQLLLINK